MKLILAGKTSKVGRITKLERLFGKKRGMTEGYSRFVLGVAPDGAQGINH